MPPPPPPIPTARKRKKWTEEEERSLITKYAEMQSDGVLAGRNLTREKKFRPIAAHVISHHHSIDSISYPFLWSWKDVSTKVQNMRHQYLLVKQKLLSSSSSSSSDDQLDWSHGLSLWPNFLLYRDVFGDAPLPPQTLGLGFEECADEDEEAGDRRRKKKRRRRGEEEWEWEEGMERRRAEWKERMDGMVERHRAEMGEMRARLLREQQAVVNQLVGIVSQFGGVGGVAAMGGGSGGGGGGGNYASQMMNGMAPGENRVGGDGADDRFVVDA